MHKHLALLSFLLLFSANRLLAGPGPVPSVPECDLSVTVDIPSSRLTGTLSISAEAGKTMTFDVHDLEIKSLTLDTVPMEQVVKDGKLNVTPAARGTLAIGYEASFSKPGGTNTISASGISLSGVWYPRIDALARYRLRAILPRGYEAVSEAEQVDKTSAKDHTEFLFRFIRPTAGIDLIASNRYDVLKERVNGIELSAYVFREDRAQAKKLLQQAKRYLEQYETVLTRYPYRRLSLAEVALPPHDSLPTLILLGRETMRHPEAARPLLSRDLLRQWFGNSVMVSADTGNWADGLIACLASELDPERAAGSADYRKQLLLQYKALVDSSNEISLRDYRGGEDAVSRAIGIGKGSMVFHMLRRSLGDEAFFSGLKRLLTERQFSTATWDALRVFFEQASRRNLALFFTEWVDGKGLPALTPGTASVRRKGDSFETSFVLQQDREYHIQVPAVILISSSTYTKETVTLDSAKKDFRLSTEDEPQKLVLDREYDVARRLTDDESPPVLATLLAEKSFLVVLPASNKEAYAGVIRELKERGGQETEPQGLKNETIKSASVVVLGADNPIAERLFGWVDRSHAGFAVDVRKNPWNADKVVVLIKARSRDEADKAFPKLSAHALFSRIAFEGGMNISRETGDSERGMIMDLRQPAAAIDLKALRTLKDVIAGSAGKKIVYVGEYHDKHAHHAVQLEMIKSLYEKNPKLAIGMEMFQRPFQKVVDDYISGAIDERAFLKGTEYFKRWVFDYNLYKPILDFARSRKIPVIALNQKKEITDKVAKTGLDSLTDEERSAVPQQMDFSDNAYRDRLKAVFDQHKGSGEKNFDFFYQAQILWDETMALSLDEFLQKNPEHTVVVIAGGGHMAFGSGIPKRSFRRNGLPYTIVLNDGELDRDIADYLVLPQPLEGTAAPKLMAALKAGKSGLTVLDLPPDSVSRKAGIRPEDTILALDGEKIENIEDVKLVLFFKQKGQTLKARILRKRLFLGDKLMELEVQL